MNNIIELNFVEIEVVSGGKKKAKPKRKVAPVPQANSTGSYLDRYGFVVPVASFVAGTLGFFGVRNLHERNDWLGILATGITGGIWIAGWVCSGVSTALLLNK